jgi:hypothetical protein
MQSTAQDRGTDNGKMFVALTRGGEYVESGHDLDALVTVIRNGIIERGHGDVCCWAGEHLAAVIFDEGSTLILHRLASGGVDALKAAYDAMRAGLPASARASLARASLTDHPASTVKLMFVGLHLLEAGLLDSCPSLMDRLGKELSTLQPSDLRPGRPAPRAPGSQR